MHFIHLSRKRTVVLPLLFLSLAVICFCRLLATEVPELLKNINTTWVSNVANSQPNSFCRIGTKVVFSASRTEYGREIWVTDGTHLGTTLLKDINIGTSSSSPTGLVELNGECYFMALTPTGRALWKTNGTAAGTVLIKALETTTPTFSGIVRLGNELFFSYNDGISGTELWKSDGTSGGTVLVKNIQTSNQVGSNPDQLTLAGGRLYFTAVDAANGQEIWSTDGTESGTVLARDIRPGSSSSLPRFLTAVGSHLYFTANNGSNGEELWSSDGTASGTTMIKDIRAGSTSTSPTQLKAVGSQLYFVANDGAVGQELWKSDGTTSGTVLVKDIRLGSNSSFPEKLTALGSMLLLVANDGTAGAELWISDGTAAGTTLLKDVNPGSSSSNFGPLVVSGSNAYFSSFVSGSSSVWKSDGTTAGTLLLKSGMSMDVSLAVEGGVYFQGFTDLVGSELMFTDGSTAGTRIVSNIEDYEQSSSPGNMVALGEKMFFTATTDVNGQRLWQSDGTSTGTSQVLSINASGPYSKETMTPFDNSLYLLLSSTNGSFAGLWKTDGSEAGTQQVLTLFASISSPTSPWLTKAGDSLYFVWNDSFYGNELHRYGPSTNGRSNGLVKDINMTNDPFNPFPMGPPSSNPSPIGGLGDWLIFAANDGLSGSFTSPTLWKTDGTASGTEKLRDINPQGMSSEVNGWLIFYAYDPASFQSGLWKTDGTIVGTTWVKAPSTGGPSSASGFLTIDSTLYFVGTSTAEGSELWKTDGTEAGTMIVKDVNPNSASSNPYLLTRLGSSLVFVADEGIHGQELWISDGTAAGTQLLKDIRDGSVGSAINQLCSSNGKVYFRANDGISGEELWQTDGTTAGTVLVSDLIPGSAGSTPSNLAAAGGKLYFSANVPPLGDELYALTLPLTSGQAGIDVLDAQGTSLLPPPSIVSFGDQDTWAGPKSVTVTVKNVGTAPLNGLTASLIPGSSDPTVFTIQAPLPSNLAAGATTTLVLQFDPPHMYQSDSLYDAQLTVSANNAASGNVQLTCFGRALSPSLDVAVDGTVWPGGRGPTPVGVAYDFGRVVQGQGKAVEVIIYSQGPASLSGTCAVSGSGYEIIGDPAFLLPSGQSKTLQLKFNPSNNEPQFGIFQINANGHPGFSVYCQGKGNTRPLVQNTSTSVLEDSPFGTLLFGALSVEDLDGDALALEMISYPQHGVLSGLPLFPTAALSSQQITYGPNTNYHGSDAFSYRVYDGYEWSAIGTVQISVLPMNDPPTANTITASTDENSPLTITVSGSDIDSDPLVAEIFTQPEHGSVSLHSSDPMKLIYTPTQYYSGSDSFTYRLFDGQTYSNAAAIFIGVSQVTTPQNIAISSPEGPLSGNPTSYFLGTQDVNEGEKVVTFSIRNTGGRNLHLFEAILATNPQQEFRIISPPAATVLLPGDSTELQIGFDPNPQALGVLPIHNATLVIRSDDPDPSDDFYSVNLSAIALQPRLALAIGSTVIPSPMIASVDFGKHKVGTSHSRNVTISNTGDGRLSGIIATTHANGVSAISHNGPSEFTLLPGAALVIEAIFAPIDASLSETSLQISTNAPGGDSLATVTFTGKGNFKPTATAQLALASEDVASPITLDVVDEDDAGLSIQIIDPPAHGSLALNDLSGHSLTYFSHLHYYGPDRFTYKVSDGQEESGIVEVTLTVTPINDLPLVTPVNLITEEEVAVSFTPVATDIEGDLVAFSILTDPPAAHGLVSASLDEQGKSVFTYTPNSGYHGPDLFYLRVSDGNGEFAFAVPVTIVANASDIVVEQVDGSPLADGLSELFIGDQGVYAGPRLAQVVIKNVGLTSLRDLSLSIIDDASNAFAIQEQPAQNVAPGGASTAVIAFDPLASIEYVGEGALISHLAILQIASNDEDENPYVIGIRGRSLHPNLQVSDGTAPMIDGGLIHFGQAPSNGQIVRSLRLKNTGSVDLDLAQLTIEPSHPAFSTAPGLPPLLTPGQEFTLAVTFAPILDGSFSTTLKIHSNDENAGLFDIELTGSAARPAVTTQPESLSVLEDAGASLSVLATGSEPLTYQWYQGMVGDTAVPLASQLPSLSLTSLQETTSYWVKVSNSYGVAESMAAVVSVTQRLPVISSQVALSGQAGSLFQHQIAATFGPHLFTSLNLPSWLHLSPSTGQLTGTPMQAGTFEFTITAQNDKRSGSALHVMTIRPPAPVLTSSLTGQVRQGLPWNYSITATNSPTNFGASGLPSGIGFEPTTGLLSGIPTQSGTYPIAISAQNEGGTTDAVFILTVTPPLPLPVITSPAFAAGTTGQAFAYQGTASNEASSFSLSQSPAWLSITPAGLISGVPPSPGSYSFRLNAANTTGSGLGKTIMLSVAPHPEAPVITSLTEARGRVGDTFSYPLTALPDALAYTLVEGSLPLGLALDSDSGLISGTPQSQGNMIVFLRGSNAHGDGPMHTLLLSIGHPRQVPVITSPTGLTSAPGEMTFAFSASFDPTSFAFESLPVGLEQIGTSGIIAGSLNTPGTYGFKVRATNGDGIGPMQEIVLVVAYSELAPRLTSFSLPTAYKGLPYHTVITATSPTAEFIATDLPPGLTLSSSGSLDGLPSVIGRHQFTAQASDLQNGQGPPKTLELNVEPLPEAPEIIGSLAEEASEGQPFAYQIQSTSPLPILGFHVSPSLPDGLSLSPTGLISGSPTVIGDFVLDLSASSLAGQGGEKQLHLTIRPSPNRPAILSEAALTVQQDALVSYQIQANYGPIVAYQAENLPSGLVLNANTGLITGRIASPGFYHVSLRAANLGGAGNTSPLLIQVNPKAATPQIVSSNHYHYSAAQPFSATLQATHMPPQPWPAGIGFFANSLPPGISLATSGTLSGRLPQTNIHYSGEIYAVNESGRGNSVQVAIYEEESGSLKVTGPTSLSGQVGSPISFKIAVSGYPSNTARKYYSFSSDNGSWLSQYDSASFSLPLSDTFPGESHYSLYANAQAQYYSWYSGSYYSTVAYGSRSGLPIRLSPANGAPSVTGLDGQLVTAGNPMTLSILATGAPTSYLIEAIFPVWPSGLQFNGSIGQLSGVVQQPGTYGVRVRARNAAGWSLPKDVTFAVAPKPQAPVVTGGSPLALKGLPLRSFLSLTSQNTIYGQVGSSLLYQFQASGEVYRYLIQGLPEGLAYNENTGRISGSPVSAGISELSITPIGPESRGLPVSYQLVISGAAGTPTVTSAAQTFGTVGIPFTWTFSGSNNPTGFNLSDFPSWMNFNPLTGILSGTPEQPEEITLSVSGVNATGIGASQNFRLMIQAASGTPTVTAPSPTINGTIGLPLSVTLSASQGDTLLLFDATSLPFGLSLDQATGIISGTPSETAVTKVNVWASNALGQGPFTTLTFNVTSGNHPPVTRNESLSLQEDVSAILTPVISDADNDALTLSLVSLPLHGSVEILSSEGAFRYIPQTNYFGPDSFTFLASDSHGGLSALSSVSITVQPVNDPPSFRIPSLIHASAGALTTMSVASILSNGEDPDGDALSITNLLPHSARGGSLSLLDTSLRYLAPENVQGLDVIQFTLSDGQGGSTIASLHLVFDPSSSSAQPQPLIALLPNGSSAVVFWGTPGQRYSLKRSTNLTDWHSVEAIVAQSDGSVSIHDPLAPTDAKVFYRLDEAP